MPPVKPNNQISRKTRAQNRKAIKQCQSDIEKPQNKMIKSYTSQTKSNKSANDTASDSEQPTTSTGINNRKQLQMFDTKPTVKKNSFQSKPIIKDVAKRINNYSKQFTPEYFTTILEYMIERQQKNSMSPTAQKISKWREFVNKKHIIQDRVRKQVKKVRNMIINSRKKFEEEKQQEIRRNRLNQNNIKQGYKINSENIQFSDDDQDEEEENDQFDYEQQGYNYSRNNSNLSYASSVVANQHPISHILPNAPQKLPINPNNPNFNRNLVQPIPTNSSSSRINQSQSSYWLPSSVSQQSSSPKPDLQLIANSKVTQQQLNKQWDTRFDTFAILIQSVYDLLGQNQCLNTIFPACYILYTMVTSDIKVFNYLSKDSNLNKENPTYNHRSFDDFGYPHRSSFSKSTPPQMLEYYIVVSLLIATKYHEIYPASLIDMIQSINVSLSVDKALKIQCQILEMLNFNQYFNDHQAKFLKMFIIVAGWTNNQMNVCEFILESGLNNPKLYKYSPMHKAAIAMGLYEQKFFKTQQKFMMIKNICPGLSLDLANQIKKEYLSIIIYNHKNDFDMQKKKFFIFDKQMKNLIKKPNLNGVD